MDFFLGIRGPKHGFVMLCCDTAATQQIITIKHDEDKLVALDGRTVMALSGERVEAGEGGEGGGCGDAAVRRETGAGRGGDAARAARRGVGRSEQQGFPDRKKTLTRARRSAGGARPPSAPLDF